MPEMLLKIVRIYHNGVLFPAAGWAVKDTETAVYGRIRLLFGTGSRKKMDFPRQSYISIVRHSTVVRSRPEAVSVMPTLS